MADMEDIGNPYRIFLGNLRGRGHMEDLDVDDSIISILQWVVGK